MKSRLALSVLCALSLGVVHVAGAQTVVTTRWVNFRRTPSNTGAKLRVLAPNETLTVRAVPKRIGWTAARDTSGEAGWIGSTSLREIAPRVVPDSGGRGVTGDSAVTVSGGGNVPTGTAANRIDVSWAKPPIVTSTIKVKSNSQSCGPIGDGVDDGTDLHKNRADVATNPHFIALDAIRSLPDTSLWKHKNRKNWSHDDSLVVMPYEGIPVIVEGYFEIVKPQSNSAPAAGKQVGEAPNCHSWDELDTDWHIALVADPSEHEERAVVVEPTPRSKRSNPGWTPAAAKALAVRHAPSDTRHESSAAKVRVTGFLMLDPVHPDHIRGSCTGAACAAKPFYRATLWEVHPVTKIEVWKVDKWVDLNTYTP